MVYAKRALRRDAAGGCGLSFESPLKAYSDEGAHSWPDDVDPSRVEVTAHQIWGERTYRVH